MMVEEGEKRQRGDSQRRGGCWKDRSGVDGSHPSTRALLRVAIVASMLRRAKKAQTISTV